MKRACVGLMLLCVVAAGCQNASSHSSDGTAAAIKNSQPSATPKYASFGAPMKLPDSDALSVQQLMADPKGYIFQWLLGYSGGLGSIAGVLVCDYWLVRKTELELADLYRPDGVYPRVSWAGIGATGVGCFLAWIGLVVPPLRPMFDYAWFVGALGSGLTYWIWKRFEKFGAQA